jgi:AcrR family transcriptional regulator
MPQRTNAQIQKALTDARGMVTVAARKLGVSRRTIYNRLEKSEELREALEEARDFTSDVAELKLFQAIEKGEAWAVCFYLKCQAKDRGYVEKQQVEHSGADGGPLRFVIERDD